MDLDFIKNEIFEKGYYLFNNAIDEELINKAKSQVIKENIRRGEHEWSDNSIRLLALFFKNKIFLELFKHEIIHKITKKLIGQNYIYSLYQANTIKGKSGSIEFHTDHPTQLGSGQFKSPNNQYLLSLQMIVLLDDFTEENGGTIVVPFSHKKNYDNDFHGRVDLTDTDKKTSIIAKKGSILFYDPGLIHSNGINKSNLDRSILIISFCQPFTKPLENLKPYLDLFKNQQEDFKKIFGSKLPESQVSKTHSHRGNILNPIIRETKRKTKIFLKKLF